MPPTAARGCRPPGKFGGLQGSQQPLRQVTSARLVRGLHRRPDTIVVHEVGLHGHLSSEGMTRRGNAARPRVHRHATLSIQNGHLPHFGLPVGGEQGRQRLGCRLASGEGRVRGGRRPDPRTIAWPPHRRPPRPRVPGCRPKTSGIAPRRRAPRWRRRGRRWSTWRRDARRLQPRRRSSARDRRDGRSETRLPPATIRVHPPWWR